MEKRPKLIIVGDINELDSLVMKDLILHGAAIVDKYEKPKRPNIEQISEELIKQEFEHQKQIVVDLPKHRGKHRGRKSGAFGGKRRR